ncbi:MAG: NAD(P)H-dependent oxidoreductase [Rhizobiaceae bacterium]|jgi:putative NADPH-quinone reductase
MRVLVVYCHPVPESFGAALRDTVVASLREKGDEVRLVDLYAEDFNPVMGAEERRHYNERASEDPVLKTHFAHLAWAEAIIFVYPTWWYGLPAMLKGWLDRVWATDVAFQLPKGDGPIVSLMTHISKLGVVTTCGAPWWLSVLIGQPGRKTLLRGMWALTGKGCRTVYLAHYNMDKSTSESRSKFVKKVKARLKRW